MKSIFEQFDSILSSIQIRKAKPFINVYKGKINPEEFRNENVKKIWENIIDKLRRSETPEEFFGILKKSNSPLEKIFKKEITEILNSKQLKDWENDICNDGETYNSTEKFIERCKNNDFKDAEEFVDFCLANSTKSFARLLREIFDYGDNLNYFYVKKRIGSLVDEARRVGDKVDAAKNTSALRHVYDSLFGKNYRIILPIEAIAGEGRNVLSNIDDYTVNIIPIFIKYFNSIGDTKEAEALENLPKKYNEAEFPENFNVFKTGMYQYLTKEKQVRIGKLLFNVVRVIKNKPEFFKPTDIDDIKRINTLYNQREVNPKEKIYLVLSRHPYDIAGMSTGRGWTSCQSLERGVWQQCIATTIGAGALICYFCRKSDTIKIKDSSDKIHSPNEKGLENRRKRNAININIQNPLGRVLIKTYSYHGQPTDFETGNFLLKISTDYGTFFKDARSKLQDWLDTNWNVKVLERTGNDLKDYYFTNGQYFDHQDSQVFDDDLGIYTV